MLGQVLVATLTPDSLAFDHGLILGQYCLRLSGRLVTAFPCQASFGVA